MMLTSALAFEAAPPALAREMNFHRIAFFGVAQNTPDARETSAEILAVSGDGMTVVYSESPASVLGSCDLGGQADSAAVAPDGSFINVAIQNECDKDLGDGRVPQMPAG
jgi:hypothetical protein